MKIHIVAAAALAFAIGFAGPALAQGRHDDKPHGYDKAKAEASAKGMIETPAATGGRHDEKPHGSAKKTAAKSTDAGATNSESATAAPKANAGGGDTKVSPAPTPTSATSGGK